MISLIAFAVIASSPATFAADLAKASPGDTVTVAGTVATPLTIKGRTFSPPITVVSGTFPGVVLDKVDGVTLVETTVVGSGRKDGYAWSVNNAKNITIKAARTTNAHRGMVIANSSDFTVKDSYFYGLGSDGIDIALSRRGVVADNVFTDFTPKPGVYSAIGALITDGDHPDGIQMWSRPEAAPVSDIVITGNVIVGSVQCVFGGNHVRNGVDDGGFDRITVERNICRGGSPRGVSLSSARNSFVRYNDARALANVRSLAKGQTIKVQVLADGPGTVVCGNTAPDVPKSIATKPC